MSNEEVLKEKGDISIHTENILPIIKKWLYSDKEIFIRELVANAVDACTKINQLASIGEFKGELGELEINIKTDSKNKTLTFSDTGIGMSREDVKKYINQIAFSGAEEFLSKYKDKSEDNQIIGHFGLGFYSAFMVSQNVEIFTKTFTGETAVHWVNDGGTEFSLDDYSEKTTRGSDIVLHIDDESKEFLEEGRVKEVIQKYCDFLPFPIKLNGNLVNDRHPLWLKSPRDVKDEEYKEFYKKLFPFEDEPLFWIHFEVEVPFRLRGILYFPKIKHELDSSKGRIKLYCNQVFVSDNSKDIIPEFLTLLQGCLDIPDIPLNVSRSYLQNDPYVRKISEHITRKVADKLSGLYKTDRPTFEKYWDDINIFVKFGMMREDKFYEKTKDIIIFKTSDGVYKTLEEYKEKNKGINKESEGKQIVLYASDEKEQIAYINMAKEHGLEVILLGSMIDVHFIQFLETKDTTISFSRIDSDTHQTFVDETQKSKIKDGENKTSDDKLKEIFEKILKEGNKVEIKIEPLKNEEITGMIILPEYLRRFKEMNYAFSKGADVDFFTDQTLIVNSNNPIVKEVLVLNENTENEEKVKSIVNHIYDLALLSQNNLKGDRLLDFIKRSNSILENVK
jgi:molecular chaperone HtpG